MACEKSWDLYGTCRAPKLTDKRELALLDTGRPTVCCRRHLLPGLLEARIGFGAADKPVRPANASSPIDSRESALYSGVTLSQLCTSTTQVQLCQHICLSRRSGLKYGALAGGAHRHTGTHGGILATSYRQYLAVYLGVYELRVRQWYWCAEDTARLQCVDACEAIEMGWPAEHSLSDAATPPVDSTHALVYLSYA